MPGLKNIKGFTLIELLVVIGMLGVLATGVIILVNPSEQLKKGRDSQRKADLRAIQTALELYRAENGAYPLIGPSKVGGHWNVESIEDNLNENVTYLVKIPIGPSGGTSCTESSPGDYGYAVPSDGSKYTLFTYLENTSDPDATRPKPKPLHCPVAGQSQCNAGETIVSIEGSDWPCPASNIYNYWVNTP